MLAETSIVTRCTDAAFVNAVVNDPAVRPFVGPGTEPLDLSSLVASPLNLFFMGEYGGIGLFWTSPRVYEVHTFVLKAGRGDWARKCARSVTRHARAAGATSLWTRIAPELTNVIAYAQEMGMVPTGIELETFGTPHLVYEMEV